jgi:hypothetical protein
LDPGALRGPTGLEREFDWSEMTATKYMRVAEVFKSKPGLDFETLAIDASALYLLAKRSVPIHRLINLARR